MQFKPIWSLRRFWFQWLLNDIQSLYYKIFFGIKTRENGSILPRLGNGTYISIIRKGSYIDIIPEQPYFYKGFLLDKGDFIRLVPILYDNGLAYEIWFKDYMYCRGLISIDDILEMAGLFSEAYTQSGGENIT